MPEKQLTEELQDACAALIGCLDRLAAAGIQRAFAERLSHEVAGLYAVVCRELDPEELRAEGFGHIPPKAKAQ